MILIMLDFDFILDLLVRFSAARLLHSVAGWNTVHLTCPVAQGLRKIVTLWSDKQSCLTRTKSMCLAVASESSKLQIPRTAHRPSTQPLQSALMHWLLCRPIPLQYNQLKNMGRGSQKHIPAKLEYGKPQLICRGQILQRLHWSLLSTR